MSTDQSYESGMGSGREQGGGGTVTQSNEFGLGNQAKDTVPRGNEENMGTGRVPDSLANSNQGNEFGLGNEAKDVEPSRNEEGMGAENAPQSQGGTSNDEYGMGSGRPENESGMGILPGQKSGHKEGGGFMKKVENIFHK